MIEQLKHKIQDLRNWETVGQTEVSQKLLAFREELLRMIDNILKENQHEKGT